jgi:CRP-like cAMP-binding protein
VQLFHKLVLVQDIVFREERLMDCANSFCKALDDSLREVLCSAKVRFKFGPKQDGFFYVGEGQLILIDHGHIITVRQRSDGKQKGIEVLRGGDILGLSQLCDTISTNTIMIMAREKTEGCLFTKEFFRSLCLKNGTFANVVLVNICRRFSDAIAQIEHLSLDNSMEKLLFAIGRVQPEIKLTHEELGILAGMNRVTTTKMMQIIKKKSLLMKKPVAAKSD